MTSGRDKITYLADAVPGKHYWYLQVQAVYDFPVVVKTRLISNWKVRRYARRFGTSQTVIINDFLRDLIDQAVEDYRNSHGIVPGRHLSVKEEREI
jgi:hypothetical protein